MAADVEYLSPEQLLELAQERRAYTFIYNWRDDDGVWIRYAKQFEDTTPEVAYHQFWLDRDKKDVKLSAVLQGLVATIDESSVGHLPDLDPSGPYLQKFWDYDKQAATNPDSLHWFTVFGSWDTGQGFKPFSKYVRAVDALHAELILRSLTNRGEFIVAGVVNLRVPVYPLPEYDMNAATGEDEYEDPSPAPPPSSPSRIPLLIGVITAIVAVLICLWILL